MATAGTSSQMEISGQQILCNLCRSIFAWEKAPKKWTMRAFKQRIKSAMARPKSKEVETLEGRFNIFHLAGGQSLEASAVTCLLCALVWECLTIEQRCRLDPIRGGRGEVVSRLLFELRRPNFNQDTPGTPNLIGFGFVNLKPATREVTVTPPVEGFDLRLYHNDAWEDRCIGHYFKPTAQAVDPYTGSETSWKVALNWLNDCRENHKMCNRDQTVPAWKPSRLIAIDQNPGSEFPFIKLSECGDMPDNLVYTTLSHCWGTLDILRLTAATIEDMKNKIPWDDLSKTFQDAVSITQRLGVRFLWIDSLCIIQDSEDDWKKESALMQHVYGNSFLNIAATSAQDGRTGCFFQRNPLAIQPTRVDVAWEKRATPETMLISSEDYYQEEGPSHFWLDKFEKEPLNRRAWVVQERILSPRILHFTSSQLVWECNERALSEQFPEQVSDSNVGAPEESSESTFWPYEKSKLKKMYLDERPHAANAAHNENLFSVWEEIVEVYSSCELTRKSDKPIAISGVVRELARRAGRIYQDYTWGLWRGGLESGLLWYATDDNALQPSIPAAAPSWSWLSAQGSVRYPRSLPEMGITENIIKVLGFGAAPGFDQLGDTGMIQLRSYMTTARLSDNGQTINVSLNNGWEPVVYCESWVDIRPCKENTKVFLVPILKEWGIATDELLYGIILEDSPHKDTFRRVGCFRLNSGLIPTRFGGRVVTFGHPEGFDLFWKSCFEYASITSGERYDGVLKYIFSQVRTDVLENGDRSQIPILTKFYEKCDGVVQHKVNII